ncbi:hypothetical protein SDC9_142315 [bioreactor metagenome]|uniref:Uncharacterized protein n=1 Tax=bioreactor metagenome TaxID=1076179 RepID=A0A645E051_9ZZZZ
MIDQSSAYYLAGSLIGKGADVVAAHVFTGNIGAGVRRQLQVFSGGTKMLVGIVDAGHEAILIVNIGRISDTVDYSHFTGFAFQSGSNAGEETAFFFPKQHGVNVVQLYGVALGVRGSRVYQNDFFVGVVGGNRAGSGKLEAGQH